MDTVTLPAALVQQMGEFLLRDPAVQLLQALDRAVQEQRRPAPPAPDKPTE